MSSISNRELFLNHVAQTSPAPIGLEIVKASGCSMWDVSGKEYLDLISGFSVANIGHGNQQVIEAITRQATDFMHLMVYGELIEKPQVAYAKLLIDHLPASLDCVYFTNSGTEATEGALKLAKRFTGRSQIIAFKNAYHGSTHGALSVMGDEYWRNAYRPLLPDVLHLDFNDHKSLASITSKTACVIAETIQAEAGVHVPTNAWLQALRQKCTETDTLLILDEIQAGFGRTGTLWAFEQYGIVPDILLLGKALGGGMPLGAFIASKTIMHTLTHNPVLGHISTFAGHPVCCAAGMAAMEVLLNGGAIATVSAKEALFRSLLVHPRIKSIRSCGLLMAVEFESFEENHAIIQHCIQNGLITDWFLFGSQYMRIAPPLIISEASIKETCRLILLSIDQAVNTTTEFEVRAS
ncbi:MAG: aspartate aminotransferase family protein [Chitinophagaceae bacterium]